MNTSVLHHDLTIRHRRLDEKAIVAELYRAHNRWLLTWLNKKLGCQFDAADLMHDTFARLLQKGNLSEIREPRAFLTTVAHGLMVNHVRRRDIEAAYLNALAHLPEATAPSPEIFNTIIETLTRIDAMLDGLPDKVRKAFLLCQLEGLTHAEIADKLAVSKSSVRQYIVKALLHCIQMVASDEL